MLPTVGVRLERADFLGVGRRRPWTTRFYKPAFHEPYNLKEMADTGPGASLPEMHDAQTRRSRILSRKTILLTLALFALGHFAWSMFHSRSIVESAVSAILGVLGLGWYLLITWASSLNDPDDLKGPARLVP
jgi:hypothetical protein